MLNSSFLLIHSGGTRLHLGAFVFAGLQTSNFNVSETRSQPEGFCPLECTVHPHQRMKFLQLKTGPGPDLCFPNNWKSFQTALLFVLVPLRFLQCRSHPWVRRPKSYSLVSERKAWVWVTDTILTPKNVEGTGANEARSACSELGEVPPQSLTFCTGSIELSRACLDNQKQAIFASVLDMPLFLFVILCHYEAVNCPRQQEWMWCFSSP